jgi:putative tricarboxylic transport membrane protein
MLVYAGWILLGTLYGLVIGVIPIAGVTTALITVFGIAPYFLSDPYAGILFLTAITAACASADSYTSILTGIPGASTTAACVIDGYPMTKNGEASRAMGIAIFDSTFNGVLYGTLAFAMMPIYGKIILWFGIPEFAGFMIMALACVGFVASKNFYKSVIAIALGTWLGMIGQEPSTGTFRYTFNWEYLGAGLQMIPLISGLFGIPELIWGFKERHTRVPQLANYWPQVFQGFQDCITNWRDMMRGGAIGFATGLLPGVGGAIGDFLAYGSTVSHHPNEKFGNGNPKGLLGCEGANNAQKVASMLPTVLFGIPAAPFAAIMMALFMYFGVELGTPDLLNDSKFIWTLGVGFVGGTILVGLISLFFMKYIIKILEIPYWIYAVGIIIIMVWANLEYTGGWQDVAILGICCAIGVLLKYFDISRPAVLVTYVVAERLESYIKQTAQLYDVSDLLTRPIFMVTMLVAAYIVIRSITNKNKGIDYV